MDENISIDDYENITIDSIIKSINDTTINETYNVYIDFLKKNPDKINKFSNQNLNFFIECYKQGINIEDLDIDILYSVIKKEPKVIKLFKKVDSDIYLKIFNLMPQYLCYFENLNIKIVRVNLLILFLNNTDWKEIISQEKYFELYASYFDIYKEDLDHIDKILYKIYRSCPNRLDSHTIDISIEVYLRLYYEILIVHFSNSQLDLLLKLFNDIGDYDNIVKVCLEITCRDPFALEESQFSDDFYIRFFNESNIHTKFYSDYQIKLMYSKILSIKPELRESLCFEVIKRDVKELKTMDFLPDRFYLRLYKNGLNISFFSEHQCKIITLRHEEYPSKTENISKIDLIQKLTTDNWIPYFLNYIEYFDLTIIENDIIKFRDLETENVTLIANTENISFSERYNNCVVCLEKKIISLNKCSNNHLEGICESCLNQIKVPYGFSDDEYLYKCVVCRKENYII